MKRLLIVLAVIALCYFSCRGSMPPPAPGYSLDWWTADSGGGTSQAGGYSLSGTVGQAEPGALHGGDYALAGGFWAYIQAALEKISCAGAQAVVQGTGNPERTP